MTSRSASTPPTRHDSPEGALRMFERLLHRTHLSAAVDLAAIVAEAAREIGALSVVLYVADDEQQTLVPVPAPDASGREALPVGGSVAGRAFASTTLVAVEDPCGQRLWLPLLDGTERVGAMEVLLPAVPDVALRTVCERYAHLVAMLIATKSDYSDHFKVLRRRRPMTVAAELLWTIAPPRVLASRDFVLGAMLEPAYDMGGDVYDYALNGDTLHLGIFDAMGHGLPAAGVAAFAVSVARNCRRSGHSLVETYAHIDDAIAEQYAGDRFVTAVLAELHLPSGHLRWVSAGHPLPLLLRDGKLVKALELQAAPPAGMLLASEPPAQGEEALEPGDMLLLYTDGLTEARRPGGELFTTERLAEFVEREAASGHPAPEALRRLREAIIGRAAGALHDDATAMLVEWRRGTETTFMPPTV